MVYILHKVSESSQNNKIFLMSLEMKFVVTHLPMDINASKLLLRCFVFKTEHVYCFLDNFNCDYKFEFSSRQESAPNKNIFHCLSLWWKLNLLRQTK